MISELLRSAIENKFMIDSILKIFNNKNASALNQMSMTLD